jgi:hypothetical protein
MGGGDDIIDELQAVGEALDHKQGGGRRHPRRSGMLAGRADEMHVAEGWPAHRFTFTAAAGASVTRGAAARFLSSATGHPPPRRAAAAIAIAVSELGSAGPSLLLSPATLVRLSQGERAAVGDDYRPDDRRVGVSVGTWVFDEYLRLAVFVAAGSRRVPPTICTSEDVGLYAMQTMASASGRHGLTLPAPVDRVDPPDHGPDTPGRPFPEVADRVLLSGGMVRIS